MGLMDSPIGRRRGAQEETSAHFGDTQGIPFVGYFSWTLRVLEVYV
jgi:hypothetical protein